VNNSLIFKTLITTGLALPLTACGSDVANPDLGKLSISTRPLSLSAIGNASYGLTVRNSDPAPDNVVWSRSAITSDQFGDGQGAISYVGPCDATRNPHVVELVLESLAEADGTPISPDTFRNPAPEGAPVTLEVTCEPNRDTPVVFNLTIMRDANQGFFDVAVNFEDIFCSAKVDCTDDLLHDGQVRGPTAVFAFACTAGSSADSVQPTWLHMTDIVLECDGQPPLYFDPTASPGQHGPLGTAPTFFQTATYRGQEDLPGLDKCYWNSAFGVRVGAAPNCRLRAQATASHASFGPSGLSPAGSVYPYVDFDVLLTDLGGNLICDNNGLDDPTSGVTTDYTPPTGAAFTHEWECDPNTAPVDKRLLCDGAFSGGTQALALPTPGGVSVSVGGVRSPTYTLPTGAFIGGQASCCVNPCCDGAAP
jgi:hypothetical protein